MKTKLTYFAVLASICLFNPAAAQDITERPVNYAKKAPLASIDPATGKLTYGPYANHKRDLKVNIIPDFSHAGYMGGGVALPSYASIPVQVTLSPQDAGDDHARITQAIDQVASLSPDARGIRGAIFLTAGRYRVSQPIVINTSGIILRGEGQGVDGTIIESTTTEHKAEIIQVEGTGSGRRTRAAQNDHRTRVTQSHSRSSHPQPPRRRR